MESDVAMADTTDTAGKHGETVEGLSAVAHRVAEKADKIKYLVIALIVIVAAAVVIVTTQRRSAASREAAAENAFYQTNVELMAQPEGDVAAAFAKMAKEYAGLPTGARSLISQFAFAFNTRDFATAETALGEFVKGYPKHPLVPRARLALGQTLVMLGRSAEAQPIFQGLAESGSADLVPEARLALAQALELDAEAAKGDAEEYRRRLERAAAAYNEIVVNARIDAPSQRIYWPQAIVLSADFALVAIKDKLAGHEHSAPLALQHAATGAAGDEPVMALPPPPSEDEADAADDEPTDKGETETEAEAAPEPEEER